MLNIPSIYTLFPCVDAGNTDFQELENHLLEEELDKYNFELLNKYGETFETDTSGEMRFFYIPWKYYGIPLIQIPCNSFIWGDSHVKIRGTKYIELIQPDHILEDDYNIEPLYELEFAENPYHGFTYYSDEDYAAYERVVNCYFAMYNDDDRSVCQALSQSLEALRDNNSNCNIYRFYYLFKGVEAGKLGCISELSALFHEQGNNYLSFLWTKVGAKLNEIYSMWNLAQHYLWGHYVERQPEKAIELYERILSVIENFEFISKHYGGYDNYEVFQLAQKSERNLRIISQTADCWEKFFDERHVEQYEKILHKHYKENKISDSFEFIHEQIHKEFEDYISMAL